MPNPKNIEKHKWEKGQSGNPKGRPGGFKGLTATLKEFAANKGIIIVSKIKEIIKDENGKWVETGNKFKHGKVQMPTVEMMIAANVKKAAQGNTAATKMLWDRMEGLQKQTNVLEIKLEDIDIDIYTPTQIDILQFLLLVGSSRKENKLEMFTKLLNKFLKDGM